MDYRDFKNAFKDERLPLAFVDLDLLQKNIQDLIKRSAPLKIRIATKSVRSLDIIKKIIDYDPKSFHGLMAFSVEEAAFLLDRGFDDVLIAYPYVRNHFFSEVLNHIKNGKKAYFMADNKEQLQKINDIAKWNNCVAPICLDIDMSVKFPLIYFGVYRSSLRSVQDVQEILEVINKCPNISLKGVMGYEAQIAGVTDNNPFQKLLNPIIKVLKNISIPIFHKRRQEVVKLCESKGHQLDFVNGGGTGSLESTKNDHSCTELTVGSGFFSPGLFDYYQEFKHQPACGFAIEVTRKADQKILTAAGGGYVASGALGMDKIPKIHLPKGAQLETNELCGEVQTPIHIKNVTEKLELGDPIILRHAKAGELCERFSDLKLIENKKIIGSALTYRGEGKCFL